MRTDYGDSASSPTACRLNGRTAASFFTSCVESCPPAAIGMSPGNETAAEIRAALQGTVDMDHEHVLVLYALCRTEPDGRHVFDAPYYGDGGSNQRAGLCHAADCSLLDPLLLSETKKDRLHGALLPADGTNAGHVQQLVYRRHRPRTRSWVGLAARLRQHLRAEFWHIADGRRQSHLPAGTVGRRFPRFCPRFSASTRISSADHGLQSQSR